MTNKFTEWSQTKAKNIKDRLEELALEGIYPICRDAQEGKKEIIDNNHDFSLNLQDGNFKCYEDGIELYMGYGTRNPPYLDINTKFENGIIVPNYKLDGGGFYFEYWIRESE